MFESALESSSRISANFVDPNEINLEAVISFLLGMFQNGLIFGIYSIKINEKVLSTYLHIILPANKSEAFVYLDQVDSEKRKKLKTDSKQIIKPPSPQNNGR